MKKIFRSLIKRYFSIDLLMELDVVTNRHDVDTNEKSIIICDILKKHNIDFELLGTGTNRLGVLIDGYAVKIALDKLGKMDNRREFKYTAFLQPYVVKVYESNKQGLICVTEYITMFSIDDYYDKQDEMRKILKEISSNFLIGDIGIIPNNYANWGMRSDGSICILDFAYIYALSYKNFSCSCSPTSLLEYTEDYTNLVCPNCGKKYSFKDIRLRITRKDEEEEVGSMYDQGEVLSSDEEEHDVDDNDVILNMDDEKKKKKISKTKENFKKFKELRKHRKEMERNNEC